MGFSLYSDVLNPTDLSAILFSDVGRSKLDMPSEESERGRTFYVMASNVTPPGAQPTSDGPDNQSDVTSANVTTYARDEALAQVGFGKMGTHCRGGDWIRARNFQKPVVLFQMDFHKGIMITYYIFVSMKARVSSIRIYVSNVKSADVRLAMGVGTTTSLASATNSV